MGRGQTDRHTDRHTDRRTCRLSDQLGPEGRVGEKSRIRETKHLSTDADSSTNTTVGWTNNTQKTEFFLKAEKNIPKCKNSKTSRNMQKLAIRPLTRGL